MPIEDDLERTSARSTVIIDMSIDVDFGELVQEGADSFANRARAMLEEKLRPILAIPWAQVKQAVRPEPEIPPTPQPEPQTSEQAHQ